VVLIDNQTSWKVPKKRIKKILKYLGVEKDIENIEKYQIPEEIEEKENMERIAYQAIKKFLHGTSKRLRKVSDDASVDMLIESLNYLCGLDSQEKISNSYKCEYHKRGSLLNSSSDN